MKNFLKNFATVTLVATNVATSLAAKHLVHELDKQKEFNKKLWDMSQYLALKLEENGVELSEFDLIAMRELGFGTTSKEEK